jgi:hypothetical protein
MNQFILTLFAAALLPCSAPGQTAHRSEFERAQRDYEAATKQALDPVKRKHAEALRQLLKRATAANDLDTAIKIKEALSQIETPSVDGRLVGTKWSFPLKDQPRDQQWIEFRADGVLQTGWGSALKTWKLISAEQVEIRPYRNDATFVIDFDASLRKGKITKGELTGENVERVR